MASPVIVEVSPVPDEVIAPGFLVNVQFPEAGSPFTIIFPVATEHEGCMMEPIRGAVGVAGWVFIVIFTDADETQPTELVTVYE